MQREHDIWVASLCKSDKGYHGKKYLITIPMYDDRRWNSSSYLRNVFKYIDIL